jgi:uncharacterized protein YndB with AHSA1/START domain
MRTRRATTVPVSPERLWSSLTDWEEQAAWMADADRVEILSAHRTGLGVRLRVRTRVFGIPAFTETMEVVAWQPPRKLAIRHGGPVSGTGTWRLRPAPDGTRFTWTEEVVLRIPVVGGLVAWCYAPILSWLMGRSMRGLVRHVG